jgi:hypothetical protein
MKAEITTIMAIQTRLVSAVSDGIPLEAAQSKLFQKFGVVEFQGESHGNPQSARTEYLIEVLRLMRAKRSGLSAVLYLMDAAWRPNSRLTNYYGFWKQLDHEGYHLPTDSRSPEGAIHIDQKAKFWGTVGLRDADIHEANRALVGRDGCFVLIETLDLPQLSQIVERHAKLEAGGHLALPICMEYVAARGGFCVYPTGGFDDPEVSVYVLGPGNSVTEAGLVFDVPERKH